MRTTAKIFGGFALYNTNYSKPFVAKFKHQPQPIYKYLPEFTDTYTHMQIYIYILASGWISWVAYPLAVHHKRCGSPLFVSLPCLS